MLYHLVQERMHLILEYVISFGNKVPFEIRCDNPYTKWVVCIIEFPKKNVK